MKSLKIIFCNAICLVTLAITVVGCVGTKVNFATPPPPEQLDHTRGRTITGSASGFQLLLFIPIGINGRHAEAYEQLKQAAGSDAITDIKITESWTYAFVGTVHNTTLTATAYPQKNASPEERMREVLRGYKIGVTTQKQCMNDITAGSWDMNLGSMGMEVLSGKVTLSITVGVGGRDVCDLVFEGNNPQQTETGKTPDFGNFLLKEITFKL